MRRFIQVLLEILEAVAGVLQTLQIIDECYAHFCQRFEQAEDEEEGAEKAGDGPTDGSEDEEDSVSGDGDDGSVEPEDAGVAEPCDPAA